MKKIIGYLYIWNVLLTWILWYFCWQSFLEDLKASGVRFYSAGGVWIYHAVFFGFILLHAWMIFKLHKSGKFKWQLVLDEVWNNLILRESRRFHTTYAKPSLEIDKTRPKTAKLAGIVMFAAFSTPAVMLIFLLWRSPPTNNIWIAYLLLFALIGFLGFVIKKGMQVSKRNSVGFFFALGGLGERKNKETYIADDPILKFVGKVTDSIPGYIYLFTCLGIGYVFYSESYRELFQTDIYSGLYIYWLKFVMSLFGFWCWNRFVKSFIHAEIKLDAEARR